MSDTILVVEDDPAVAESLGYALRAEGYEVQIATDGPTGLTAASSFDPKLIVLDLIRPDLSTTEFIGQVRKTSGVAIIVLSAKNEEIDKVVALELGADDYVTKPFGLRELVGRTRAVIRRVAKQARSEQAAPHLLGSGVDIDTARRTVKVNGREVHLPLKQFELLKLLMANKNRVMTREELHKDVWGISGHTETGSLDVHIRWLRVKIEDDADRPVRVRTVRGIGYRFVDVDEE